MTDVPAYLKGRGRGKRNENNRPLSTPGGNNISWNGTGRGSKAGTHSNGASSTADRLTAEERFQNASNKYQESIRRHLLDEEDREDGSSSDEEDIGSAVLEKVFMKYSSNNAEDIETVQDSLLHSFRSGTSACLVCIDSIRKTDQIWCCEGCYAIFHIQCIQKWIREGVYQQLYKSEDDNLGPESIPWQCPKCRLEYSQKQAPTRYLCYCGKVEDPQFDPWLVPHSCGQKCNRSLKPACGHSCLLLCHPGACPPCPQTVKVACHCGNSPPQIRRCSAPTWSCRRVCGKRLSCGQHTCQNLCHAGECPPCPKTSTQSCQCGKSTAVRPCASPTWSCEQVCGRRLTCGDHVCEIECHAGQCGPCPRGGLRRCPCGKTAYDLPCKEDIPTCGDTCGKLLDCGLHECVQRCHQGTCGQCRQMTVKKCRCELQKEKEVPCYKEYLCETKCAKMRDCGRHQCKRKCCDGSCPSCEQMCNKLLRCKNHKCLSRCHRGNCYPCTNTVDIFCFCKKTKITVPCGREKVTKPPRCDQKCKTRPDCHHEQRVPHRCHFGPCPPCRQVCSCALEGCQHRCPAFCHTAVKIKVTDNARRAGPWEGGPRVTEQVVNKPCPPCSVPISIQCYGKHETGTFACSVVQPYQCGRQCGRQLTCGNHTCELMCHLVKGAEDTEKAGSTCQECERQCEFERPDGCSHECTLACHSGPCPPCKQMFRMRCHCQVTVQHIECYKWVVAAQTDKDKMKSCGGPCPKQLSCNHQCGLSCHPGKCLSADLCERKVNIKCKCRRQKQEVKCRDRDEAQLKLVCNEVCTKELEKKKKKEEEEGRKKKEEEERKQKAELEEFERKMKGKKRKPRRHQEEVVEESFLQRHKRWLILSLSVAILAVFVFYILNIS